jgi:hypothetical protein
MAMAAPELGKIETELGGGVEKGSGGGEEAFQLLVEIEVVVVMPEHHWSGLFIG